MRDFILVSGFALAATLAATMADAQATNCASHQQVAAVLAERFSERRQTVALTAEGHMVETYASDATGTWTIVMTRPGGPSCIVASGGAWQRVEEALPVPGEGA